MVGGSANSTAQLFQSGWLMWHGADVVDLKSSSERKRGVCISRHVHSNDNDACVAPCRCSNTTYCGAYAEVVSRVCVTHTPRGVFFGGHPPSSCSKRNGKALPMSWLQGATSDHSLVAFRAVGAMEQDYRKNHQQDFLMTRRAAEPSRLVMARKSHF